jgi:hypothetical protein
MNKLNQKSINKIIFYKLFENTNDSIQNTTPDSSMSVMNEPPQRVLPNKQQLKQNPFVQDNPDSIEKTKTPEGLWDDRFDRDNFYDIWKVYWEELYGKNYTNQKEMNSEFERVISIMRWKFLKLVSDRPGYGGLNTPGMETDAAWSEALRLFLSYFQLPTSA